MVTNERSAAQSADSMTQATTRATKPLSMPLAMFLIALAALASLAVAPLQCEPVPVEPPRDTSCDDGTTPLCEMIPPICEEGEILAYQGNCYRCVDPETCEEPRDTSCDDGTTPMCMMIPPACNDSEILAYQGNCYRCVNPASCLPWGEAECRSDSECPADERCDLCGTWSCPMCDDCLGLCVEHGCETAMIPECNMIRPNCDLGETSVVRDGCWVCVSLDTCEPDPVEPPHDPSCDDGTQPICDMMPPHCNEFEIFAYQNDCYICVNPATCLPWGEAECRSAADCPDGQTCDSCATSSCPMCDDCVAACVPDVVVYD